MSVKLTHEEWLLKYQNNINQNLILLSKYNGTRNKIKVKCKICGNTYETLPSVLVSGCMCKHCSSTKTNDIFINELKENNPNITPFDSYISDRDKLRVKCDICQHEWYARPTHLLRGHGCPKCSHKNLGFSKRKTQDEFEYELQINNPTVKCLGKYRGRTKPVTVKSMICGHVWEAIPNNLIFGQSGCPICKMSKGEKFIYYFLKKNKKNFIWQKEFDGLIGVNNGNLSYDFYLPEYNLLIEYQGQYHDGTAFGQTEEEYAKQQEHDKRKREYAMNNNIELFEIWYWDYDNIEQILREKLNINSNKKSA